MDLLFLFVGLFVGAAAAWLIAYVIYARKNIVTPNELEALKKGTEALRNELRFKDAIINNFNKDQQELKGDLAKERGNVVELSRQLSSREADLRNLREKLEDQGREVSEMQKKFALEFKNLANEIFEEKSKKFTDQNTVNLTSLLNPLKDKIGEFEKKVEQTHKENIERNSALKEQILGLKELNQQITREAENLTKALKGESKTQGNWGEMILESILEKSGLIKGDHYETQVSITSADGRRYQPDVIVKLPENKNIIIDAKVSLVAYERFVNCEDEKDKLRCLKDHLSSLRIHIKGLSEKTYQSLYNIDNLDFVLLFMPVEPAFGLAVQNDPELFSHAYEKNIVIVSPTTLIATLRTISSIWRQEQQGKNAMEIARQGGLLYDKFVSFYEDLLKAGKLMDDARGSFSNAMKKLSTGKDNLVRKAERLKELGAKTSRNIDQRLLNRPEE